MPRKLLEKCCARTHIETTNGEKVNQGSGVIVSHDEMYYLITAAHCIFGENDEYKNIIPKDIWVEVQEEYNSKFRRINVKKIIDNDKTDDWVLLEIENPQIDCDLQLIKKAKNFIEEETVHFCGYQNISPNQFRPWKGTVLSLTQKEFKIKLNSGDTFQLSGEDGADIASGLSGSGVFIIRGDKLHLIGHLKSVIGEKAFNNDIKCCSLTNLKEIFKDNFDDLGDIDSLKIWENTIQKKSTEEDIEKWIKEDKDSENLTRKSKVIYDSEERVNAFIHDRILDFLDKEYEINQMRNNSELIRKYESTAITFEKSVKELYNRDVKDSNAAKDLLKTLETDFKNHIKDLIKDDSNKIALELARHKITKWLMNCTFDFKE